MSPAKPLDLYIDDDRKYCIAIFDDDDLELAIGRGGVNVNLASSVTEYRIDAFGKKEYEKKQIEQETLLSEIKNMPKRPIKPLEENEVKTVSDLLNSDEEKLIEIKGITESSLEKVYDAVQVFVEENQSKDSTEYEVVDEPKDSTADKENNLETEKVES